MQHNIKLLIAFAEIAKCGSFVGAAEKLGVTPSAVTWSMARLEKNLKLRLLNRTTRKVHLTAEGAELLEKIESHLAGIKIAIDDLKTDKDQPSGKIKLSIGATFGRYTLMPALVEYTKRYPLVDLHLYLQDLPGDLVDQGFDLGVHTGLVSESSYVSRVLCKYPLILVASPDYLERFGVPQTPYDLAKHECIAVLADSGKPFEWIISRVPYGKRRSKSMRENAVIVPHGRLSIGMQRDANISAALLGAGITLTSLPAALQFLRNQRLKLLLGSYRVTMPSPYDSINIFYPHREYLPLKVRTLIDFLVDWTKSHQLDVEDLRDFIAR